MASKKKASKKKPRRRPAKKPPSAIELGVVHHKLSYDPADCHETSFRRADLVFSGVGHARDSYEVRVFLNNRKANCETPRSREHGYAGRFVIFGHGGCFGDEGHCSLPEAVPVALQPRAQHPLSAKTVQLTVTRALEHVLERSRRGLASVTMVPTTKVPIRKSRGPAADLFRYEGISLNLYS